VAVRPNQPIYAMPLPEASARDLRVMSFNLRVATAFDLWNTWELRKPMVVEHIRSFDPDILGTQEGLAGMEDYLVSKLTDYTFYGVGRNDGKRSGEMVGVFYKTSRFTKLDGGHFWLSTRPDKPGTHGWGAWFPRMVTWVKLQPKDGAQPFFWFNTHFDAFASHARTESARFLLAKMNAIAGTSPCVVTGDFNADAGSTPYQMLTTARNTYGALLADTFRTINPTASRDEGTRHDFTGRKNGSRIDWILASPSFQAITSSIDRTRGVLGYPSDHFPMTATLRPTAVPLTAQPIATVQ
jgi:endonuclease/exonuclease/phosphatase family metal-dependent hydrolase